MDKQKKLDDLRQKALKDKNLPLKDTANNIVFGEGRADAKIYFLGEAPGRFEDLKGLPFIGQAGKILDKLLERINLKREDVFITSILWYRPPKNRDPKPEEVAAFMPYLDAQLNIVKPKVIATLGRHSLKKFLPEAKIAQVHGRAVEINYSGNKYTLVPLYHPASAIYRRDLLETLIKDFESLKELT